MGRPDWMILLPPSEGKAGGGRASVPWTCESGVFGRRLGEHRAQVVRALAGARGGDQKLLGAKGTLLDAARAANRSLLGAPTLPAWQRYTGVVWEHLDLADLPATERAVALKRVAVVSGLAGLVLASDPLPDYRLKMGARLAPMGALSTWWRAEVTAALVARARGATVVDLLPQEHRAAIDASVIEGLVRVDLVARSGGTVGGHNAKAAKGLLARHLLGARSGTLAARVASFSHPDYRARIAD